MSGDEPADAGQQRYGYSLTGGAAMAGMPDIPGGVAPWAHGGSQSTAGSAPPPPGALTPIPQPGPIPKLEPPYAFKAPQKKIANKADMDKFMKSEALQLYLRFVVNLSQAIQGKKISDDCHESGAVKQIVSLLENLIQWVDEIPPKTAALRYGNPAYREWQARLEERGPELVRQLMPPNLQEGLTEVYPYFADAFGNATRIDYGTGHEVNFAAWLLCLHRLRVLQEDDYQALVARVFVKYLELMRKLQLTYWLEPAGSHGVWGLDDYHFLPFIFGASQLVGHKYMKPKSIHNEDILDSFSADFLYLQGIVFIKKVKKGPLAEHSPMLNDISGVPNWQKVFTGMLKMYRAECLEKIPIMQHFVFGSILPWPG